MVGDGEPRVAREIRTAHGRWRASEAWRGRSGWGVLYLVALDSAGPAADDRRDRRVLLEPGSEIDSLADAELVSRSTDGAGLTSTERRITGPEGRTWLVQSRGPVWAGEGVAAGLTGLLFTALDGPSARVEVEDGHAGALEDEVLCARLREALAPHPAGDDSADG